MAVVLQHLAWVRRRRRCHGCNSLHLPKTGQMAAAVLRLWTALVSTCQTVAPRGLKRSYDLWRWWQRPSNAGGCRQQAAWPTRRKGPPKDRSEWANHVVRAQTRRRRSVGPGSQFRGTDDRQHVDDKEPRAQAPCCRPPNGVEAPEIQPHAATSDRRPEAVGGAAARQEAEGRRKQSPTALTAASAAPAAKRLQATRGRGGTLPPPLPFLKIK